MEDDALRENRDLPYGWDVVERASRGDQLAGESLYGMDSSEFHRRFATEIAQGRAEWETSMRRFTHEIASLEGAEAIYWEKYLLSVVRVIRIKTSKSSIIARVELIPRVPGGEKDSWKVACDWPSFHAEALLWTSQCQGANWRIFYARPVIDEVMSIRSSFPGTDTFQPYDSHFLALVQPLRRFLVDKASSHVRGLTEQLDSIEAEKGLLAQLRAALEGIRAALQTYPDCDGIGKLLAFIGEAEYQAGRSLSSTEAGRLIQKAYLVGRVLGGPF